MKKVLVIVGPTASGKSDLAVKLAKKFNGEVISADSRQVYKGLNIGTGKITRKEMQGVKHHILDVVKPNKQFTASDFTKKANEALDMIYHIGHIPIVVGGTGFYIDALTGKISVPDVPPNKKLRAKLGEKPAEKLFEMLKKKDSKRAGTIDPHNKVRLIRALEIVEALGKVPPPSTKHLAPKTYIYIGLKPDSLDNKIRARLIKRISGIIREAKKLPHKRAMELGLEYRFAALYLKKKLTREEFVEKLFIAIRQYSKRQMTWFKKNKKIKWFKPEDYKEIEKYVKVALGRR